MKMQQPANYTVTPAANTALASLSIQDLEAILAEKKKAIDSERESYKAMVASTVSEQIERLLAISKSLSEEKATVFNSMAALLALKQGIYGTKENEQQSHTFSDGKNTITIGYRLNDRWDDSVTEKVNDYIRSLAKDDESASLANTLVRLLRADKRGGLRSSAVIELQKLADQRNDQTLKDGVSIIIGAKRSERSVLFVEASTSSDIGDKISIPLSMSAVDFPEGFAFEFPGSQDSKETTQ
jgi:hypothetical protein